MATMSELIDMEGKRIGRLTVLGYAGSKFRGRASRARELARAVNLRSSART